MFKMIRMLFPALALVAFPVFALSPPSDPVVRVPLLPTDDGNNVAFTKESFAKLLDSQNDTQLQGLATFLAAVDNATALENGSNYLLGSEITRTGDYLEGAVSNGGGGAPLPTGWSWKSGPVSRGIYGEIGLALLAAYKHADDNATLLAKIEEVAYNLQQDYNNNGPLEATNIPFMADIIFLAEFQASGLNTSGTDYLATAQSWFANLTAARTADQEVTRIVDACTAQGASELAGYHIALLLKAAKAVGNQASYASAINSKLSALGSSWEAGGGSSDAVQSSTRNMLSRGALLWSGASIAGGWGGFLASKQRLTDGVFNGYDSKGSFLPAGNIQSNSYIILGLSTGSYYFEVTHGCEYLRETQRSNGSWYSYPLFGINDVYKNEVAAAVRAISAVETKYPSQEPEEINHPPVFDEIQPYVMNAGDSLTFTVNATDEDGDPLSYSIINAPTNSSFNAATRTFKFKPSLTQVGLFKPKFAVTDGKLTDQIEVQIQVNRVNQSPVLDFISDRSVLEGETLSFFITASDPDNDPLTFTVDGLPENASFNEDNGSFSFSPEIGQADSYDVTFTVSDPGGLTASQTVNILVLGTNLPPELGLIESQVVETGDLVLFVVTAEDPTDDLSELIFSADGLPTGASFAPSSRIFAWTPSEGQIGGFRITFTVTDPEGLSNEQTVLITVLDPLRDINLPPVLGSIGNKSVQENSTLTFQVNATDPNPGDVISLSVRGMPGGASFATTAAPEIVSGTFQFTPGLFSAGTYRLTFTVTDGDFVDEEEIELEVTDLNLEPEISGVGDHIVMVGEELIFDIEGIDASGENVVLSAQNLPANAIFLPSGRFSFTPSLAQAGMSYAVTFRVTDASGLFVEGTSNIDVEAVNVAPVFIRTPNQEVQENAALQFSIQATDANEDELTYSVDSLPPGAAFDAVINQLFYWIPETDQAGSYRVNFMVEDPGGLADTMAVNITVGDANRPPSISDPGPQTVLENETLTFTVTATDADNDPITLSALNMPTDASFTDQGDGSGQFTWTPGYLDDGPYRVTFSASDGTLEDNVRVSITVEDVNLPPTLDLADGVMLPIAEMEFEQVGEGLSPGPEVTEVRTFNGREGAPITIRILVSDPGADATAISVRNLPPNARLYQSTAKVVFTPSYEQSGDYLILIEVTDGVYTQSMFAAFQVEDFNRSPVLRPIGDRYVDEGNLISFEINASDPDGDPISYDFTGLPGMATLVNNLFTFDTQLLPPDLQVDAVHFVFEALDGRGGSDSEEIEIAVIRADIIDFTGPVTMLSGTIEPSDSVVVDIREGIGMDMSIKNTSGNNVTTGGTISISEISGPLSEEVAEKIQQKIEFVSLASATEGNGKVKLARQSTIKLAGGLETGFYSIRRSWEIDLSSFTAVLSDLLQSTLAAAGDSINVNVTVFFQDNDLVRNFGVQDSTFMKSLVPAAWDSSQGSFVLLSGTVDTSTNTGSFTIPLLSADDSDIAQYKLFTVGSLLDFNAPTVLLTKSFTASGPGPYKIEAEVTDDMTGVQYVKLIYEIEGESYSTLMELKDGKYEALIAGQEVGTVIKYYCEAMDNQGNLAIMPTRVLNITASGVGDVDENGSVNIFDLIALLNAWINQDPTGDINQDGEINVWDLIALLSILAGRSEETILTSSNNDWNAGSAYNLISSISQAEENLEQYSASFGVSIKSLYSVSAAELEFKLSEDLKIGALELQVDDPLVQMVHVLDGDRLRVLVFDLSGKPLPLGRTLLEVSYNTAGNKLLTENMIVLENSRFGDLEGNKVEAMALLDGLVSLPRAFSMSQNYPNPFNPSTTINFEIPEGDKPLVNLGIYSIRGQLVRTLINEVKEPGTYSVQWDGKDNKGSSVSSGVYFYRISAGEFSKTRKMVLLK